MGDLVEQAEVDAGGFFLLLFDGEGAVLEADLVGEFGAGVGEAAHVLRLLWVGVAVEEAGQFFAVTVQVEDHFDFFLFIELGYIVFYTVHLRKRLVSIKLIPLPIQIMPHQIRPVVPNNHPIRIHHRNNLKNKVLPQELRFLTLPK